MTHFDRFKYAAHCFKGEDIERLGLHAKEGRLHFLDRSADFLAAERQSLLQNMACTARDWLVQCRYTHNKCHIKGLTSLPTRLIDVRSERRAGQVCLRLSDANELGSYAALSYCWGGTFNFLTTASNIASHLEGISEEELPLTVKQAVYFTRLLSIDYLWVDAICIIQDSKEDKTREIRNMRTIFKNAYVTLVASHASSVSDGFLFPEYRPMSSFFTARTSFGATDVKDISVELVPFSRTRQQPVNKRAWTLEERLLSSKLLIFSSHGLFWQCEEQNLSMGIDVLHEEGQDVNVIGHRIDSRVESLLTADEDLFFRTVVQRWFTLVGDYTSRSLTRFGDKMLAIAGIAEEFSHNWGARLGEYQAGLWSNYFVDSLAWQTVDGYCIELPMKYRAPSWSWAAVDSTVATFPGSRGGKADHKRRAKVSDIQVKNVHVSDPFRAIDSSYVTVQVLTMHGSLIGALAISRRAKNGFFEDRRTKQRIRGSMSPDFKGAFESSNVEYRIVLVECYLNDKGLPRLGLFLVLIPARVGLYRRIGVFRSSHFLVYEHLFELTTTTII